MLSLRAFSEDVSLVCVAISWRFKSSFSISWGVEAGVAFFFGSQGVDLTVARPTFFVSWRLIRRKFVLQRFILTTVH